MESRGPAGGFHLFSNAAAGKTIYCPPPLLFIFSIAWYIHSIICAMMESSYE